MNIEDIKVSVIVPCYNVEKYVVQCLTSIQRQLHKNLEIICVNDGSTDNTYNILYDCRLKDERIILLDQENKGLSAARNLGMRYATGDYIVFVDSDDWIDIAFIYELLRTAVETDSDIAVGNITRVWNNDYENLVVNDKINVTDKAEEKYRLAKVPEHCYVWNKLYKTKALLNSKVTFKEGMDFEDILFTNKILYYARRMCTVPNAIYYYRRQDYSLINSKSDKWITDFNQAQKEALRFRQSINPDIEDITKFDWTEIDKYKLFNIVLLTVKTYGLSKLYYLFGKLLIFQKDVKRRIYERSCNE